MSAQRFFIGLDKSSHRYLVPVSRYDEWEVWTEMDDEDEDSWDVPPYATRIDGGQLTFADPRVEKL